MSEVLSQRALNRALLARQGLLERFDCTPAEAIERLVGLQAQVPNAPYVGLHTRLRAFAPDELSALLRSRDVVRLALMRSTVHLVTARDCLRLRPVVASVLERQLWKGSPWGKALAGLDPDELVAAGREILDESPRTNPELARALHARFPARDGESLANGLRNLAALVQLPPRGVWGVGGVARLATAESWLGAPLAQETAPDEAILRYLGAFGPASARDVQTWSGLTRLGEVLERLRPQLASFRDEQGRELFDLPGSPRPDPATAAPPRFLPEYDNALLSHADRARIIAREHRPRVFTKGALLVDGFVRGTWSARSTKRAAALAITPFRRISKRDAAAVEREAARLLGFLAPGSLARTCEIMPVA